MDTHACIATLRLQDANFGKLECRTNLSHAHLAHFMSNLDALVQSLSESMGSQEAPGESVTCSVGVHNLIVRQTRYRIGFRIGLLWVDVALG